MANKEENGVENGHNKFTEAKADNEDSDDEKDDEEEAVEAGALGGQTMYSK